MDAAAVHWHLSLYPIPLTDDFSREEERRKAIQENTGMVVEECMGGKLWNVEVRNVEEGGCNERNWKESGEVKECKSEKIFWYNTGKRVEGDRLVQCEYSPRYWLLSRSWPPRRVNPNPGMLPLWVQAALSSWLSIRPCVDTSRLPLKINTLPPRSSPPNGQPTATSVVMTTDTCMV